jgi:hypothetical protein
MKNIDTSVSGNVLTIRIKLDEVGEPSATGKSLVVASTRGNHVIPGTDLTLGLNAYRAAPKQPKAAK